MQRDTHKTCDCGETCGYSGIVQGVGHGQVQCNTIFIVEALSYILYGRCLAHRLPHREMIPVPRLRLPRIVVQDTLSKLVAILSGELRQSELAEEILRCIWIGESTGEHTHGNI